MDGWYFSSVGIGSQWPVRTPKNLTMRAELHPHRQPPIGLWPIDPFNMAAPTVARNLRKLQPSIASSYRSDLHTFNWRSRLFSSQSIAAKQKTFIDPIAPLDGQAVREVSASFARSNQQSDLRQIVPIQDIGELQNLSLQEFEEQPRHHLHIYSTKHNTHIALTKPNRDALISVSCGNIGFRKAGRGSYDAAYQLAAFVMSRIQDKGLLTQIQRLEVIYRGFGQGREAVTKAILGSEGRNIRGKIVRLTDATRLKFGGTRSPAPRRLG